jgi:sec-independent protein translocase protein TatA
VGNIGPWELILILFVALLAFGPGKLPEVAKLIGKAANEFKRASNGVQNEVKDFLKEDDTPVKPAPKTSVDLNIANTLNPEQNVSTPGTTDVSTDNHNK